MLSVCDADEADGWVLGLLRLLVWSWKFAHLGKLNRLRLVLLSFFGACETAAEPIAWNFDLH